MVTRSDLKSSDFLTKFIAAVRLSEFTYDNLLRIENKANQMKRVAEMNNY